jgi:hypothetical protein
VDVIGHQAETIELEPQFLSKFPKRCEIHEAVGVGDKDRSAIVTALHDVMRIVGDNDPSFAWHACLLGDEPLG